MDKIYQREEPYQVYIKKNNKMIKTKSWACGKCGQVYTKINQATDCCKSKICSKCNKIVEHYHLRTKDYQGSYTSIKGEFICYDCFRKHKEEQNIIENWDGFVCYNETLYESLEDFICRYKEDFENKELPEYVEIVETDIKVPNIDIDPLLENACENIGFEDAINLYKDINELYEFMDKWNAKQTATYWSTNGKKVKVKG